MISINEITILGRLGETPIKGMTQTGKPSVKFSVCTNERFKVGEEVRETNDWHDVIGYGGIATMLGRFNMQKGQEILIRGKLKKYKSTDSKGREVWHTYIQVTDAKCFGHNGSPMAPNNTKHMDDEVPTDLPF